jgi:hypothetical protein
MVLLEPATRVLELLQPQSKSSLRIFFNPAARSVDEEEDLLREVSSPHKDPDPNEEEAFLDAYVLQLPPTGVISINNQQLPSIESASPSFRQNAPQKTMTELLDTYRWPPWPGLKQIRCKLEKRISVTLIGWSVS